MQLLWKRTVIGGQVRPFDFLAYCELGTFARIEQNRFGPSAGVWNWYLTQPINPFSGLPYGSADSKQEAVDMVVRIFETLQAQGKLEFHPEPPKRTRKSVV